MISSAFYYRDVFNVGYLKAIPHANFIHDLVNYPEKYDTAFFSHTRNSMGKDFGFHGDIEPRNTCKSQIRKYLDQLNSDFLLVLIMENFDESLVMLKRVLNWSFHDIVYFKINSHKHEHTVLNSTEKAKFRNTSFLDFEIYEYFEDDFYKEVEFFQTVLVKTSEFCLRKNSTEIVALSIGKSRWDEKFQVTQLDCEWMKTKELSPSFVLLLNIFNSHDALSRFCWNEQKKQKGVIKFKIESTLLRTVSNLLRRIIFVHKGKSVNINFKT
ncbi:galactose-3-O-sulfotransferase 2-like [Mercenaria mercenaria]|uniref:galactose-3-O-sulfotransferase 2-like n=1 Tax=Mercenaria mercenaria TaxID=6596 RepID=UPI00234ECA90|nr:galactose-3-O-sulfotransferase 2-like [Mercenaria mercenaria]